jgi:hypothetical protein
LRGVFKQKKPPNQCGRLQVTEILKLQAALCLFNHEPLNARIQAQKCNFVFTVLSNVAGYHPIVEIKRISFWRTQQCVPLVAIVVFGSVQYNQIIRAWRVSELGRAKFGRIEATNNNSNHGKMVIVDIVVDASANLDYVERLSVAELFELS